MTLDMLPLGQEAVITAVGGEGALRCRLLDMGLIPKTHFMEQISIGQGPLMALKSICPQENFR